MEWKRGEFLGEDHSVPRVLLLLFEAAACLVKNIDNTKSARDNGFKRLDT